MLGLLLKLWIEAISGLYSDLFVLLSLHTNSTFVGPVKVAETELECRLSSRGSFSDQVHMRISAVDKSGLRVIDLGTKSSKKLTE